MANETLYATLSDTRLAEVMSGVFLRKYAARDALPQHPALLYAGNVKGAGSTTFKIGDLGIDGYVLPASTGEIAEVANTELEDGSTTVTVARFSKSYEPSDLARITDGMGVLQPERLAVDAAISAGQRLVDLVANLMGGFSTVVGATGVNFSVQNFLDGKRALRNANVPGPYLCILHPNQWSDFTEDLALNSGGGVQYLPATEEQLQVLGNGFQGTFAGVQVFTTTRVPTANSGADYAGGMFGAGAVAWADGSPVIDLPGQQFVIGDRVLFEIDRSAKTAETAFVSHVYLGVTEVFDAGGVAIITDA